MKHIIINNCKECPYETMFASAKSYCSEIANLDYQKYEAIPNTIFNVKNKKETPEKGILKDCPLKDYPTTVSEFLKQ